MGSEKAVVVDASDVKVWVEHLKDFLFCNTFLDNDHRVFAIGKHRGYGIKFDLRGAKVEQDSKGRYVLILGDTSEKIRSV